MFSRLITVRIFITCATAATATVLMAWAALRAYVDYKTDQAYNRLIAENGHTPEGLERMARRFMAGEDADLDEIYRGVDRETFEREDRLYRLEITDQHIRS